MTKISQYSIDQNISGSDKWIGSDSQMQNATKNFTPDKLAKYFNDNQVIDTGAEVRFKYVVLNVGEQRPFGSVTFVPQQGNTVAFSGITSFILSKRNTAGNLVPDFIEFLDDKKILISKTRDINTFGYYNVVSVEEYEPEPDFYEVNIEFIAGNGGLTKDIDFVFEFISNAVFFDYDFDAPLELNGTTVSINQATSTTDGYLSSDDWNTFNDKQNEITLTTTGSSGPATLVGDTLNIPQYQSVLTNPITGTGTISYVPRFTGTTTIGNGSIFDNGTNIGIGTTTLTEKVNIVGRIDIMQGSNNIYVGRSSGTANTTGQSNTAFGVGSMFKNTSGSINLAIGASSLYNNLSGGYNTAIGVNSLFTNTNGSNNVGVGYQSLYNNISGAGNVSVGYDSMVSNTTGTDNVALGYGTLFNNSTGIGSTAVGKFALYGSTGSYNVGIGMNAALLSSANTNSIVIGYNATGIGSNTVVLGNSSIVTTVLRGNVGIGTTAPTESLHVTGNARVTGSYYDSSNSAGTSGQVLSSTGAGTDWVSLSEITGVDGTGTANYVSKWLDANTITNSIIFDNGTNVGIGTTSPTTLLDVRGGLNVSDGTSTVRIVNSGGVGLFGTLTTHPLAIRTDNTERMRITSAGNVGIGTTSPSQKLEVAGGQTLLDKLQYTRAIDISGQDLNNISSAGFYNGNSLTNAPTVGWFYITVERYDADTQWVHQTATSFGSGNTANIIYSRTKVTGTWGAWKQLTTSSEISGTTNYVSKFTGTNSLGNSQIFDNGTNVGIGTTTPIGKLDVVGTSAGGTLLGGRFSNITANATGVKTRIELPVFNGAAGGVIEEIGNSIDGYRLNIYQSQSSGVLTLGTAGDNERMRITSAGNVGIGTISPNARLDVQQSVDGNAPIIFANSSTGTLARNSISLGNNTGTISSIDLYGSNYNIGSTDDVANGLRILNSGAGGVAIRASNASGSIRSYIGSSEVMRVASNSNVGIGTSAPSIKLQVETSVNGSDGIWARNTNTGTSAFGSINCVSGVGAINLRAHSAAHSVWPSTSMINSASAFTGGMALFQDGANPISLWTNGSERMRVTSAGNIGIGTTSPNEKLHVYGTSVGINIDGTTAARTYYNRNGSYIWSTGLRSGDTKFYIYDERSASRFVIDDSGNVGIGTTSPTNRLHVLGGILNGAVATFSGQNNDRGLVISTFNSGSSDAGVLLNAQTALGVLSFATVGSERMRIAASGNVGIGTTAPSSSAVLDLTSTTQGFLPPRMTTSQRTSLGITAAPGLIVYDTDDNKHYGWNGSSWNAFY